MPRPKSARELGSFLGKVSYLRRFVPGLAEVTHPLMELLRKGSKFAWEQMHQDAMDKLKTLITSPQTMIPPKIGIPLRLYLTSTKPSIGALLAQEMDGIEKPVYYLSRTIHGPEVGYPNIERHCLALVFVAQKLRHYLLSFTVHIVIRCDPIKFFLARIVLIGRAARWFLILSEYDLKCIVPRAIKS